MKKISLILLLLSIFVNAKSINECKVDLYYATDIILPEDEKDSERVWVKQSIKLLEKYPQIQKQIGDIKVAYNLSNGIIGDYLVKIKEDSYPQMTWTAFKILVAKLLKGKGDVFTTGIDAAISMFHQGTVNKQIETYNQSIESGRGVIVVAHAIGNLFTEEVFKNFSQSGDKWKEDYFHTIAVASTQSDIINNGKGITFDNDIVFSENLSANDSEEVVFKNPNRYDYGFTNIYGGDVLYPDELSFEYHKFEYYLGYTVNETTRVSEYSNIVESKPRQTNIAKDMITQWLYDEVIAHKDRKSQWEVDEEFDKNTKDYRVSLKHKYKPFDIRLGDKVFPFNTEKKVYQVNGKYVKASCGGENIQDNWEDQQENEFWLIDNPEEEKIVGEEERELVGRLYLNGGAESGGGWEGDYEQFYNLFNSGLSLSFSGFKIIHDYQQETFNIEDGNSLWDCIPGENPCKVSNEIVLNEYVNKNFGIKSSALDAEINSFFLNEKNQFDDYLSSLGTWTILYGLTFETIQFDKVLVFDTSECTNFGELGNPNADYGGSDGHEYCRRSVKYQIDIYK